MTTHPNYELFEELGRTETTIVYRAHDLALGRDVAIKELTEAGKADPRRQERLMREAQDLAQTEHAGILRIHTVVPENGWIVMELMRGSLANQIRHSEMKADTVRSIVAQLLSALDFLHSQGKLHGAIRPSNVLIDAGGTVRLSDFEKVDIHGELRPPLSTKKYLAPEWIRGEFGSLGPASDLYCLAFMAFELLAGPRFDELLLGSQSEAADPEVAWLRRHSSHDPLPLVSDTLPEVPADLAQAIDAMLIKSVPDRIATAAEALVRLNDQPVVAVEPVAPSKAEAPQPTGIVPSNVRHIDPLGIGPSQPSSRPAASKGARPDKRRNPPGAVTGRAATARDKVHSAIENRYVLYPLCGLILLLALGLGLFLRSAKRSVAPTGIAMVEGIAETDEIAEAETVAETEGIATIEGVDEANEIATVEGIAATDETAATVETASTDDLTDTLDRPVDLQPDPATAVVIGELPHESTLSLPTPEESPPPATSPAVSPPSDFMKLVSEEVEVDTTELLKDFKGDPEIVIDAGGFLTEVSDVAIDPQGRWVAASGDKVVRLWNLASGDLVATLRGDRSRTSYGDCHTLAFSPDGQHLVVGVGDYQPHGAIRVYRVDAWDEIDSLLPGHTSPVRQINFSRDGQQMASVDADGNVAIWDWPKRKILRKSPPRDLRSPIVDELHFPGQESILMGIDFTGPFLLNANSMQRMSGADPLPPRLYEWMVDLLQRRLKYPFDTSDDPRVVDLKLEQNLWAAAGIGRQRGTNRFWIGVWPAREAESALVAEPQIVYSGHRWQVRSIDIQPTLGLAASGDKFGEVHVWKIASGDRVHRFQAKGKPIYEAAFDRDSPRIAFGVSPYPPDRWGRNHYGPIDKVLDLAARSIYAIDPENDLSPIQEKPSTRSEELKVTRMSGDAGVSLVKLRDGQQVSKYQMTTGRTPTVFTFLDKPVLGLDQPVLFGDSEGLLAVWDAQSDELRRAFIGHDAMVTAISVAEHGRSLLSGSSDRTIRWWSLEAPVPTGIFDFKFENSVVTQVMAGSSSQRSGVQVGDRIESVDGMSMKDVYEQMLAGKFDYRPGQVVPVTMRRDGSSYKFEMTMAQGYDFSEPILSAYIGDQNQWILWTPQGYYDASPGAEEMIGWHINRGPDRSAAYFPVGHFRELLYRPDIIDRLINGQAMAEAIRGANRARDESASFDFRSPSDLALHHPPVVEILKPESGSASHGSKIEVEAVIRSPNGLPIREVTLLVDGIAIKTVVPDSPVETEMTISHELTLTAGEHWVEWVALNPSSRGSESVLLNVAEPPPASGAPPAIARSNLIVLAIGTSLADQAGSPTRETVNDAERFAEVMSQQAGGRLYRDVSTRVLTGERATRAAILDGFQWMVDQVKSDDTVVIYLSADAFIDPSENFYIGAHDVDIQRLRATAVSWREFVNSLHTDLPGCRRIAFLDLRPSERALKPGLRNPLLDLAAPELGTVFLSSTALQQRVPKSQGDGPSFLTAAVEEMVGDPTLDSWPTPPDGLLSYEEASTGWSAKFRELSADALYPVVFVPAASRQLSAFELIEAP